MIYRPSLQRLRWIFSSTEARFLAAGGWNTIFGYLAFLAVYYLLGGRISTIAVLCLAYAISLIQSFVVQRLLVFRAEGNLVRQFLRFASASSAIFFSNLVFLPLAERLTEVATPVLQGVFVAVSTVVSYFVHKLYSFAR